MEVTLSLPTPPQGPGQEPPRLAPPTPADLEVGPLQTFSTHLSPFYSYPLAPSFTPIQYPFLYFHPLSLLPLLSTNPPTPIYYPFLTDYSSTPSTIPSSTPYPLFALHSHPLTLPSLLSTIPPIPIQYYLSTLYSTPIHHPFNPFLYTTHHSRSLLIHSNYPSTLIHYPQCLPFSYPPVPRPPSPLV